MPQTLNFKAQVANRKLTKLQSIVLAQIVLFQQSRGYPPTVRELGELLSIVHSVAHTAIASLEHIGILETVRYRSRSIKLLVPVTIDF